MTYDQLKEDVAALGFESNVDSDAVLLICANRALNMIFADRPQEAELSLLVSPPDIAMYREVLSADSSALTVSLCGGAFSFTAGNKGVCRVEDRSGSRSLKFDTGEVIRQLFDEPATLILESGSSAFNLVCYSRAPKTVAEIPPYKGTTEINLAEHIKDLQSFSSSPENGRGEPIKGAVLRNGSILLPRDYRGMLTLRYMRSPISISSDSSERIDISNEVAHLLPILTAAFLWLDDAPEKAQYYMALYREGMANIIRYSKQRIQTEYKTNGWA